MDFRLSRAQRNEIATLASEHHLDLAEFAWHEELDERGSQCSSLKHTPTGSFMAFEPASEAFWLRWWPNWKGPEPNGIFRSWGSVIEHVDDWLEAVSQEVQSVDLWEAARAERAWLTEPPAPGSNAPFTAVEREQLVRHLQTIEEYAAKTFRLTSAQRDDVAQQFAYLRDATKRLGRFDWKNIAVSTLIAIALQLSLSSEQGKQLLAFATKLLGPLVAEAVNLLGP